MSESSLGYFVFRAVGLQILLLGIWWTILYRPSIALLRLTAEVPLSLLLGNPLKGALEVDSSSPESLTRQRYFDAHRGANCDTGLNIEVAPESLGALPHSHQPV